MFGEIKIEGNNYLIVQNTFHNNPSFVDNVMNDKFSMQKIKTCGVEYKPSHDDLDVYKMILQYVSVGKGDNDWSFIYAEFGINIPMNLLGKFNKESLDGFALENIQGDIEGILIKLN